MNIETLCRRLKLACEVLRTGRLSSGAFPAPGAVHYMAPYAQTVEITGEYDGGPLDIQRTAFLAAGDSIAIDITTIYLKAEWCDETFFESTRPARNMGVELRMKFS